MPVSGILFVPMFAKSTKKKREKLPGTCKVTEFVVQSHCGGLRPKWLRGGLSNCVALRAPLNR